MAEEETGRGVCGRTGGDRPHPPRPPTRTRQAHHRTSARITALEETHDALRICAERAESDLDTARAETHRLTEQPEPT
jgi:hypothetical protein